MFSDEQKAELGAPLNRSAVKQRKQGSSQLSYIEAWHAIDEANRIFGFDGWDRKTVEAKIVVERARKIGQGQYERDGWGVTYTAKVLVIAGGVTREGTGAGHGIDADLGLAHESAIKEAESDAMKRALMTFGNPFGLALYDKAQENVVDDQPTDKRQEPAPRAEPQQRSKSASRDTYKALETDMRRQATTKDLADWWKDNDCREKRASMPQDWQRELHEEFKALGFTLKAREDKEAREPFPGSVSDREALQQPMAV